MGHQQDTVKLMGGAIVLYKRGDNSDGTWQARLELGGGKRTRRSLKTADQAGAERAALELYSKLKPRADADMPLNSIKFDEFWDKRWIPWVEKNLSIHRQRLHNGTGNRYIKPYFDNCTVDKITVQKVENYAAWRREKGTKRPAQKTLLMETGLIRQALDQAVRWSLCPVMPRIKVPLLKTDPNRAKRFGFDADEWFKLAQHMDDWQHSGQHKLHNHQRQIVRCLVWFYYLTGMRPREAALCKWSDVKWTRDGLAKITVMNETKTGTRIVFSQPGLKPYLQELESLRKDDGSTEEEKVFLFKPGWDPHHTFRNLLAEADLLKGPDGHNRTIYSLRHTYITDRLTNGKQHADIARNCGTSVTQIHKHYDHVLPEHRVKELTAYPEGEWDPATILAALRFAKQNGGEGIDFDALVKSAGLTELENDPWSDKHPALRRALQPDDGHLPNPSSATA